MDAYSDESVRAWAYDPDRDFIDDTNQDEDLTIGHLSLDVLLPLIDDAACLKRDFILQCLDYHHACAIRSGQTQHLSETWTALEAAKRFHSEALRNWAASLERRLNYCEGLGPTSRNLALIVGREVLADLARPVDDGDVAVIGENEAAFIVERKFPNPKYRERLTIEKATGRFVFSRAGAGY